MQLQEQPLRHKGPQACPPYPAPTGSIEPQGVHPHRQQRPPQRALRQQRPQQRAVLEAQQLHMIVQQAPQQPQCQLASTRLGVGLMQQRPLPARPSARAMVAALGAVLQRWRSSSRAESNSPLCGCASLATFAASLTRSWSPSLCKAWGGRMPRCDCLPAYVRAGCC